MGRRTSHCLAALVGGTNVQNSDIRLVLMLEAKAMFWRALHIGPTATCYGLLPCFVTVEGGMPFACEHVHGVDSHVFTAPVTKRSHCA